MKYLKELVAKINYTYIGGTLCLVYAAYYVMYVAHHPRIFANQNFKSLLVAKCPLLQEKYWPTFWCFGARPQTLVRTLLKSLPDVPYQKEFLTFSDGGHAALDWVQNENSKQFPDNITRPTVVLLPGLTGSSEESYLVHFVHQATELGYRSVVFNNRGNGGAELKTPRTYCAANTDDMTEVVAHIRERYPGAPLIGAGVSLGGIILTNYLAKSGKESGLDAAFTLSVPWNMFESTKALEEPINYMLFNKFLCNNLKTMVHKYKHVFEDDKRYDLDHLLQSERIRDFDDRFIAIQFGYRDWEHYYEDSTVHIKVHKILTPLLALNAADDPFAPGHSLPLKEAEESKYVSIVLTEHGGHIGFLEGTFPRHAGYVDRLFAQYLKTVFEHQEDFQKAFEDI